MARRKRYYVIHEDDQWKVKMEAGQVLETFGTDRRGAIDRAKELGERYGRDVMVNFKSGSTGAEYHDYTPG